ncbi:MAG: hypothetical protein C4321_05970, partial [Chloroflexota bacterium]
YTRVIGLLNDARLRLQSVQESMNLQPRNLAGPSNPARNTGADRMVKMLFVALVLSAGIAVGGVIGWDYLDTRVHDRG